jgi:hypothetical protein
MGYFISLRICARPASPFLALTRRSASAKIRPPFGEFNEPVSRFFCCLPRGGKCLPRCSVVFLRVSSPLWNSGGSTEVTCAPWASNEFWTDLSEDNQFASVAVDLVEHINSREQQEREALQALHWQTWNKTPAKCSWEAIRWQPRVRSESKNDY